MADLFDETADYILDMASPQRLQIMFKLLEKNSTPTTLAKDLGATRQEVHRNFTRLEKSGLIEKKIDGKFKPTIFGQTVCTQVPSMIFLYQNRKYFERHTFGEIPPKFHMRCGQLVSRQHIVGFSRVLEQWKSIYNNAEEYVSEILSDVPLDLLEPLVSRVKRGVKLNYIISEVALVPKGRKDLLKKIGFAQLLEKRLIERKMAKSVQTVMVFNEKEACILFPTSDGKSDLSEMFYSDDPMFHEWCTDYFNHSWSQSDSFMESKLKE